MRRPRVKPEHRAYRTSEGNVRIGSVVHGIGAEVADPGGWIWTLVEAMDGSRTPRGVRDEVAAAHPCVSAEDVVQAMEDLLAAGFVEDAGAAPPRDLTRRERERYGRGATLARWMDLTPRTGPWDVQGTLREARVLLVGVGGTGGYAAEALVSSGVGHLHCVDPDVVELSNLNRQPLYREKDIGAPKVDAALATLRALNSDVVVTGEQREVADADGLAALLDAPSGSGRVRGGESGDGRDRGDRGYDLLVVAADRPPEIRRWANRTCLASGTPWVDAGYRGPLVTVGVHAPGRGACWECLRAGEVERRDLRLPCGSDEELASPRMPWNPASAVTAGLSGLLLAHASLTLLTGVPPVRPGFRFGLNLMTPGEPVLHRFAARPDCPACGTPTGGRRGGRARGGAP
ncbi:HesA/MoeB/ThiF family protein [Streptomyces sp. TR06-5]|uniref:HesA/MoeB/ThiF family protein n=1 Tax=unclassified Streptomyces TaxID=2593676 RepID=UPI0039A1DE0A